MVSHCFFNLYFHGASFHMLILHLCMFSGDVSVKVFGSFLNQVVVFLLLTSKSSLYILDNSPLSDMSFPSIFLPSCGLSFHFLDHVFHRAENFNFNEIQLINSFFHGS